MNTPQRNLDHGLATPLLFAGIGAAVVVTFVSVAKPEVAFLAARAALLVIAAIAIGLLAVGVIRSLPNESKWNPRQRTAPPSVPSAISSVASDLRRVSPFGRRFLQIGVVNRIVELFIERLRVHHGISGAQLSDRARLDELLSPAAAFLVAARFASWERGHPYDQVPVDQLRPLLDELERL